MANRKLGTEIDRVIKELSRALHEHDENFERYQSCQDNRLEKFMLETKEHLGKVIRFRHQIKQWLEGREAKEDVVREKREVLQQLKDQCEERMEEFDREFKARSRAAVSAKVGGAPLTDEEKAKMTTIKWVKQMLEETREKKEVLEGTLEEELLKKKGKKPSSEYTENIEILTSHIYNLELILRGLDNNILDYMDVDDIKYDLEEAVESGEDGTDLYETLDLSTKLGTLARAVVVFPSKLTNVEEANLSIKNTTTPSPPPTLTSSPPPLLTPAATTTTTTSTETITKQSITPIKPNNNLTAVSNKEESRVTQPPANFPSTTTNMNPLVTSAANQWAQRKPLVSSSPTLEDSDEEFLKLLELQRIREEELRQSSLLKQQQQQQQQQQHRKEEEVKNNNNIMDEESRQLAAHLLRDGNNPPSQQQILAEIRFQEAQMQEFARLRNLKQQLDASRKITEKVATPTTSRIITPQPAPKVTPPAQIVAPKIILPPQTASKIDTASANPPTVALPSFSLPTSNNNDKQKSLNGSVEKKTSISTNGLTEDQRVILSLDIQYVIEKCQLNGIVKEDVLIQSAFESGAKTDLTQVKLGRFVINMHKNGLSMDCRRKIVKEVQNKMESVH